MEDLTVLKKKNRPALKWALKKLLLIERDPEAGAPLGGTLHGFRKLTVGDRDWRVIWRVTHKESGDAIVDIGEVWAVGAREDLEVYAEMSRRVAAAPEDSRSRTLDQVLALLGGQLGQRLAPAPRPPGDESPVPEWLRSDLIAFAGYNTEDVSAMTERQALAAWATFRSSTTD